ncbi:CLUMA_CG006931, isoform A, partial [Clunio marinus]
MTCSAPTDGIDDSIRVSASVSGDVLGPALKNLKNLIRMPHGCGEQVMITFVPNLLINEYLTVTNQMTPELLGVIKGYLENAYQKMLSFRHTDGSFSAFGKKDTFGSTWLTAYVAKYFRAAQSVIDIDELVIAEALEFLKSKQNKGGSFREDGIVLHENLQSETSGGVAFTAFVALGIQDNLELYPEYKDNVDNAVNYIMENCQTCDLYSLALATYLLHRTDNHNKGIFIEKLMANKTKQSEYIYWKNQPPTKETSSIDIEITSYALLTINLISELYDDGFKILHWLVSQQNFKGGFISTQDTVVALQAITKFASKFSTEEANLSVDIQPEFGENVHAAINQNNRLTTQTYFLDKKVRMINVVTKGKGYAVVQLSCNYHQEDCYVNQGFNLSMSFGNDSCDNKLIFNVCASYSSNEPYSNMIVVKIDFPSGFIFDFDTKLANEIQKLEETAGGSSVNVYMNSLSVNNTCFNLTALRMMQVYNEATSNIEILDFYDTNKRAAIFYKTPSNLPKCYDRSETALPPVEKFTTMETLLTTPTTPITSTSYIPSLPSVPSSSPNFNDYYDLSDESRASPLYSEDNSFAYSSNSDEELSNPTYESKFSSELSEAESSDNEISSENEPGGDYSVPIYGPIDEVSSV